MPICHPRLTVSSWLRACRAQSVSSHPRILWPCTPHRRFLSTGEAPSSDQDMSVHMTTRKYSSPFRRNITTLDPERLTSSDWLDLFGTSSHVYDRQYLSWNSGSRKWRRLVTSKDHPYFCSLHYVASSTSRKKSIPESKSEDETEAETENDGTGSGGTVSFRVTFPDRSLGFLYYHRPPYLHPKCGEIRFRLSSSSDQRRFKYGTDLLMPNGLPWRVPLFAIASRITYAMLRNLLLCDGLVSQSLIDACAREAKGLGTHPTLVSGLNQPFPINFAKGFNKHWIFGDGDPVSIRMTRWFVESHQGSRTWHPYTGRALCQFELSPLPEHEQPTILVRVLKIIEPITVSPEYEPRLSKPTEGEFICKEGIPLPFHPNNEREEIAVQRLLDTCPKDV